MSLLFIMPLWSDHAELWMQRMLEAVEPQLAAIGAWDPAEKTWRGRVRTIALRPPAPSLIRRTMRRARLPVPSLLGTSAETILQKAVEDPSVTVVLAHYLEFALVFQSVWDQTSKPLFVHCHGYDVTWDLRRDGNPDEAYFPGDYVGRVRRLAGRATLIANSNTSAQRLFDVGISPEHVRVKYLGVPVPDAPPSRHFRTNGLEILYLGRLIDCKGPDLVIRAFEEACERGLDAHLTLAGDGVMRTTCELLARRSPFSERIRLLGWVDAARGEELRNRADIFTAHNCRGTLSHQEEAYGVSIVEAMACALPVVSGRNGSLAETVIHGETGLLVQPWDVSAHAEAFLTLANQPELRRRMGEAGWRRAGEVFSSEKERLALLQILGLPSEGELPPPP